MRLVDTSAWIEWLASTPTGEGIGLEFPEMAQCIVPTMVQFELTKWLRREVSEEVVHAFLAYSQDCVVTPLSTAIALRAAELSHHYKLASADAIIYASALYQNADLLTCDHHFEGLPDVIYIMKTKV